MRTLVFIPAWNEEELDRRGDRRRPRGPARRRLLVVDDGSIDATAGRPARPARESPRCRSTRASAPPCRPATSTRCARAMTSAPISTPTASTRRRGRPPGRRGAGRPRRPRDRLALPRSRARPRTTTARPSRRRIGTNVFRFALTLATRQRFTDTTSGMRAANRRVMALFSERYSPDFAELESLQRAVRQGLRVEELPVRMLPRPEGTRSSRRCARPSSSSRA